MRKYKIRTRKEQHTAIRGENKSKDENFSTNFEGIGEKMSEIPVTEVETERNARNTLPDGYSVELTTLTRKQQQWKKIKSVLLEKRVEGVMKIEDKERS